MPIKGRHTYKQQNLLENRPKSQSQTLPMLERLDTSGLEEKLQSSTDSHPFTGPAEQEDISHQNPLNKKRMARINDNAGTCDACEA
jgi:hypothetical protein